jgi:hypothetical protein
MGSHNADAAASNGAPHELSVRDKLVDLLKIGLEVGDVRSILAVSIPEGHVAHFHREVFFHGCIARLWAALSIGYGWSYHIGINEALASFWAERSRKLIAGQAGEVVAVIGVRERLFESKHGLIRF